MYCRKCKPKKIKMKRLFKGAAFTCPKCGFLIDRTKSNQKLVRG